MASSMQRLKNHFVEIQTHRVRYFAGEEVGRHNFGLKLHDYVYDQVYETLDKSIYV